jgi:hypothetical protein
LNERKQSLLLRLAAVLAMVGLAFMVWGVLVPTPMPVILAMSIGQGIGTLSFMIFLLVVITDLRRAKVLDPEPLPDEPPPAPAPPETAPPPEEPPP